MGNLVQGTETVKIHQGKVQRVPNGSMAAPVNTLFHSSVSRILDSWTVLKLAVEHGFGGPDSQEKAEWMAYAVEQWFTENKNLDPYEVESFLADILNVEFDTIADDGSLSQIAAMICGVYRLCSDGKEDEVNERLQRLPKCSTRQCTKAVSDDESDNEVMDTGPTQNGVSHRIQNSDTSQSTSNSNETGKDEEMEDDGWTVVQRGKKK